MFKMVSSGPSGIPQRKTPVWSKPHPQQSLKRQPLQPANNRIQLVTEPMVFKHESEPIIEEQLEVAPMPTIDPEYKPCGVLKKPGSYRSHHGLKKVAFLENTELNRSTLWKLALYCTYVLLRTSKCGSNNDAVYFMLLLLVIYAKKRETINTWIFHANPSPRLKYQKTVLKGSSIFNDDERLA